MNSPLSRTEARNLQKSIAMRIDHLSKTQGRSKDSIRYQLLFECFLQRIFAHPDSGWVLKGGTALLMRNGHGRFTQDIDLARAQKWDDTEEIRQEFEKIARRKANDPFVFEVTSVRLQSASTPDGYSTPTIQVKLSARLGANVFHAIKIDVSIQRHTQLPLETVLVEPLFNQVSKTENYDSFYISVIAIESHLADKICAMYERHRSGVSNRYRDLADIIQIIRTHNFSIEKLSEILNHETNRRHMEWPEKLNAPGPDWEKEYERNAPEYDGLPANLHTLQASLDYAGACLNEVLEKSRISGIWNHQEFCWEDPFPQG